MPFETPLALLALASVIPLIILYLLRPKPLLMKIPSVMFLMQVEEKKRFYTSITKLIKDPLFLIQLLVLILLALAAAAPYIITNEPLSDEHTVLVIDASASMQTDNRFQEAISKAGDYVSKKNSIVIAHSIPVTLLEGQDATTTKEALSSLKPGATVADISAAMGTGMRMLSNGGGRLVVISDFTNWEGEDPVSAKNLAESYGFKVEFVKIGGTTDNVGIIQGQLETTESGYTHNCVIKNYGASDLNIPVDITTTDGNSVTKNIDLTVKAKSTEQFVLQNLSTGTTTIKINRDDSLPVDNVAYISVPKVSNKRVLFVSEQSLLPSMTSVSLMPGIQTTKATGVPQDIAQFSVVVVAKSNQSLSSNEISLLSSYINSGGKVVFIASDGLAAQSTDLELQKLLPVRISNITATEKGLEMKVNQSTRLTDDLNLDEIAVYKYLNATSRLDTTTLIVSDKGIPMLAYGTVGEGTVVYVGFSDQLGEDSWNNFYNQPDFPVFWFKLVGWLGGSGDISEYNLKTGAISTLAKQQEITTPDGKETTNKVLYSSAGLYEVAGRTIAVNLYNDKESDTTIDASDVISRASTKNEPSVVRAATYESKNYLDTIMIVLVFILVILELYIIKKRGEL
ncbi:VWA domain-containing protein [uncultured Methanomethylovorans sp.]|uniref:VWA domain-containing protein n=1 Tax=uncultured Methanomethylovorans sp. TaxID=183759 RepID=UPI002AA91768|nr:VWA domain-containing protein [uncultured Methanomethylovorans sp.]